MLQANVVSAHLIWWIAKRKKPDMYYYYILNFINANKNENGNMKTRKLVMDIVLNEPCTESQTCIFSLAWWAILVKPCPTIILFDLTSIFILIKWPMILFPLLFLCLHSYLSICITHLLQDHFTNFKKMAINMKYIGTFHNGVWFLIYFL